MQLNKDLVTCSVLGLGESALQRSVSDLPEAVRPRASGRTASDKLPAHDLVREDDGPVRAVS